MSVNNKRFLDWAKKEVSLSPVSLEFTEKAAIKAMASRASQISTTPEHLYILVKAAKILLALCETGLLEHECETEEDESW